MPPTTEKGTGVLFYPRNSSGKENCQVCRGHLCRNAVRRRVLKGSNAQKRQGKSTNKGESNSLKWTKRVLWFLGIVVCTCGFLLQSVTFLVSYFEYPTTTETIVFDSREVAFPGVTVCNYNTVRRSAWCIQDGINICHQRRNETYKMLINRLKAKYRLLSKKERIQLGHQKSGLIQKCSYGKSNCMEKITSFFDYHFTNCHTFNAQWGSNSRDSVLWAVGWDPLDNKEPSFLRLWLDLETAEYTPLQNRPSAKVVIHDATNLPNPKWSGFNIEPGFYYKFKIQEVKKELLPSPYQTACTDYETFPPDMRTNATLHQESCIDECLLNYTLSTCKCTLIRLALSYDFKPCESEWNNSHHISECLLQAKKFARNNCPQLCSLACRKTVYEDKGAEILQWPREMGKIKDVYNYTTIESSRKSVASVQVFFATMETIVRKKQPKFQLVEMFSYIGGFVGLWLGISLLNLFEYMKDEALCIIRIARRLKRKGRSTHNSCRMVS